MELGILDLATGLAGFIAIIAIVLIVVFLIAGRLLPPKALTLIDQMVDRPALSMFLGYLGIRNPIKQLLNRSDRPAGEVYRQVWGLEEGDDVYLIMPEQRTVLSDGGIDEPIRVGELSFPTDKLIEGETHNICVTPIDVNSTAKRVELRFLDADEEWKNVALFSDSAPQLVNRSFSRGTEYVLTDVKYERKQSDDKTYHNLRATRSSGIWEAGPDPEASISSGEEGSTGKPFITLNDISFDDRELQSESRYNVEVQPHTIKWQDDGKRLYYDDADGETRHVWVQLTSDHYGIEYKEGNEYQFVNAKYLLNKDNGDVYHNMLSDEDTELHEREADEVQLQRDRYPMFKAVVHVYGGLMRIYDNLHIKVMTDSEFKSSAAVQNENLIFIGTKKFLENLNVEHGLEVKEPSDEYVVCIENRENEPRPKNHHDRSDLVDGGGISKRINPNNRSRSQIVLTGTSNKGVIGASKALMSPNPDAGNESFNNCQYVIDETETGSSSERISPHFDVVFDVHTRHGDPEIPTIDREPIRDRR